MRQIYEALLPFYPHGLWSVYIVLFTIYQFMSRPSLPDIHPIYSAKIPLLIHVNAIIMVASVRVVLYHIFIILVACITGDMTDYLSVMRFMCLVAWSLTTNADWIGRFHDP